jgi:hypothetical protein
MLAGAVVSVFSKRWTTIPLRMRNVVLPNLV